MAKRKKSIVLTKISEFSFVVLNLDAGTVVTNRDDKKQRAFNTPTDAVNNLKELIGSVTQGIVESAPPGGEILLQITISRPDQPKPNDTPGANNPKE